MKLFLLTFLLGFSLLPSFGQDALTQDNRILGGSLSFSQNDADNIFPYRFSVSPDDKRNSNRIAYTFSPYYGRFYKDHQMVGLWFMMRGSNIEQESLSTNFEYSHERSERSFGLGGFLRQYFPFSDKFGVFVEEGIGLRRNRSEFNDLDFDLSVDSNPTIIRDFQDNSTTWAGSIDAEVGIYFFLLDRLSIETRLARFFMAYGNAKHDRSDLMNGERLEDEGTSTDIDFRFINQFSFDSIFTLNYYF